MPPKVFLLSGMDNATVTSITEKLGRARVESSGEYDSSVTHIIIAKVCRSEKLLCCTAGGKWVLHPDYITDSEKVSLFISAWLCFTASLLVLSRPVTGCRRRATSGATRRTTSSSPRTGPSSNWPLLP